MKKLTLLIIFVVLVVYLLIGAAVFQAFESENEDTTKSASFDNFRKFIDANRCVTPGELETFIKTLISAYDQGVLATNQSSSASNWDFGSSLFFSMTVVTTIGYGNISPSTSGGRVFFVFYALCGIPLAAVFLAGFGEKLQVPMAALKKKNCFPKHEKLEKILKSVLVIFTGFIILIFVPSGIFAEVEGWTFGESLYYSVVTLTTVGFGDYVIGQEDKSYRTPYRIVFCIWIIAGLSWVALMIGEATTYYKGKSDKIDEEINKSFSKTKKVSDKTPDEVEGKSNNAYNTGTDVEMSTTTTQH